MPFRGTPDSEWIVLADKFPVTLARDAAPESLQSNETPEAYGLGIDKNSYLYIAPSVSGGTAWTGIATVSEPAYAPATCTWRYAHGRLWGWETESGSNLLYYGDYGYDSNYFFKGLGYVPVADESSVITNVIPLWGGKVAIFKSDHLYLIDNADNPGDSFTAHYVKQSSGLPVAGNVIVIDDLLVWANTYGIFAFDGQSIRELTYPIRSSLAPFVSTSLTTFEADFEKRRVVGLNSTTSKCVIDLNGEKPMLYDYSTSGFRFTSRTLVAEDASPLVIDRAGLIYQYSASDRASITLEVAINGTWKKEDAFAIFPTRDSTGNGWAEIPLQNVFACRKFALRITALTSSFYISAIKIHLKQGGAKGFSSK